jgi:DNA topoisomerase I
VAKIIRACQELPGQDLLQYFDEDKQLRCVSSGDVNDYLRSIAGYDVTAKNFRTWAGTVLIIGFLKESGPFDTLKQPKRVLRKAIGRVAVALGNTPAVCRKSYVDPAVVSAYFDGVLVGDGAVRTRNITADGLRAKEEAALALLCGGGAPPSVFIGDAAAFPDPIPSNVRFRGR